MPLDNHIKRMIFAVKENYYSEEAREKLLDYAPNSSYSLFMDLVYKICALAGRGHLHPSQLDAADVFGCLEDPVLAGKAEEIMPRLEADVLERLKSIHGGEEEGRAAHSALVEELLKDVPHPGSS